MTDPFAEELPRRDRWGRPLIRQEGGGEIPYTRISTLSGMVTNKDAIYTWEKRCLAIGLGNNEGLAALAGSFGRTYDEVPKTDRRNLDDIIEKAHDLAGGHDAANYGTAFHRYTEPDRPTNPPERMEPGVKAFYDEITTGKWDVRSTEVFVVNHELRIAGTYDHTIARDGKAPLIVDKKTGRKDIPGWIVQEAAYAVCSVYDPLTGRTAPSGVNQNWGIVFYSPRLGDKSFTWALPLKLGHRGLELAIAVRDWRQEAGKVKPL